MDATGSMIEYLYDGKLKFAYVDKCSGKRLHLRDASGRELRISDKDLVVDYGPIDYENFKNEIKDRKRACLDCRKKIELELLWESLEDRSYQLDELAELYFSECSPAQRSALFQKLNRDNSYIRSRNGYYTPYSAEQVEELKTARKKQQEQQHREKAARKWMNRLLHSGQCEAPPKALEELVEQIYHYLTKGHKNEAAGLIHSLAKRDDNPRKLAWELLVRCGRLHPADEEILHINALDKDFSEDIIEHVKKLQTKPLDGTVEDFNNLTAFSIDDPETREIDDALTVEEKDDGITEVGIHIADLTHFVKQGDPVDEEALRRSATIYLPGEPILMIPELLSCDLASLVCDELRPCFSILLRFDQKNQLQDWRICQGKINVQRRLDYDEANEILSEGNDPLAKSLIRLQEISNALVKERKANGATIIVKEELKVSRDGDKISAKVFHTHSPSRVIIGECMIAANHLTAVFCHRHDIPIIYRSQVMPDEPARKFMGKTVDDRNPQVFKGLKKSQFSLYPQKHVGLGLECYTQISSPLRRYADLVLQRQVVAWLRNEDLPYSSTELLEISANAEYSERENRMLDRQASRALALDFLSQQDEESYDAVVVAKFPSFYLLSLQPWQIRGKLQTREHLRFGRSMKVRIEEIDPRLNTLRFAPA